jgi:hypothetical protein
VFVSGITEKGCENMRIRRVICWIILFLIVGLVAITVSPLRDLFHIGWDLSNIGLLLGVLGALLLLSTVFNGMPRLLQVFLCAAGASGLCWPLDLYLHSILFPLFPTEPVTYIVAFIVLPITFIIGVIGAIVTGLVRLMTSK